MFKLPLLPIQAADSCVILNTTSISLRGQSPDRGTCAIYLLRITGTALRGRGGHLEAAGVHGDLQDGDVVGAAEDVEVGGVLLDGARLQARVAVQQLVQAPRAHRRRHALQDIQGTSRLQPVSNLVCFCLQELNFVSASSQASTLPGMLCSIQSTSRLPPMSDSVCLRPARAHIRLRNAQQDTLSGLQLLSGPALLVYKGFCAMSEHEAKSGIRRLIALVPEG